MHGDYKLDNLVFHPQSSELIGILDWELSAYADAFPSNRYSIGHPLSDLANMLLPFYIDWKTPTLGGVLNAPPNLISRIPTDEDLICLYCQTRGLPYPIPNWNFCKVFSLFRMCVILQGVAARIEMGTASSASAGDYGGIFGPLAEIAYGLVDNGERSKL
jgi:aminoglycoside phosphotransferase (APT) family kinase protein